MRLDVETLVGVGDDVPGNEIVVRRRARPSPEDHSLPVAVDDVPGHDRPVGVGVELDAAVGIAVDQVVPDHRAVGVGDVDAMLEVGGGQLAAVVNDVVLDHDPLRRR